jgi:site-specific recombinase XerC
MSAVFNHAVRHEWLDKNPIILVRQTAKRERRHIRPIAKTIGIHKRIGWHTFGTLLKANGEDVKTVQELLRHANSRITLDVYTQAVNSHKRAAQSRVVNKVMVPDLGTKAHERHTEMAR